MTTPATAIWAFQPAASLPAELDDFQQTVQQFQAGAVAEAQFRVIRVPQGVYEQRESGTYMLRVRAPAGGVLPQHLRRLGEVATRYGNGVLHVTTRQEFQVHRVPLESIVPALRSLAEVGLSSKGGGGNTVRNITACFDSGVCPQEVFDVAPYAVAVTERLLTDPVSLQLPRKYKIAFAACSRDCSGATVNDVGFIARRQDGVNGFAVYVGGGMGSKSRVASLLHEFIPASEAFVVAEAIKRVFDKNGDRKNKHLARLRFLVERLGVDGFRKLYDAELAALRATAPAPLQIRPLPTRDQTASDRIAAGSPAFNRWFITNVTPQKQWGFFLVHIPLTLGDIPAAKSAALANVVAAHGDGVLWATQQQNAVLRWVAEAELSALHAKLSPLGFAEPDAPVLRNLVACAGASTCRLGICLSRGLAKAVRKELTDTGLPLSNLGDLTIQISGCPNSCGRHPVGNIGFSGTGRRIADRLVPYYAVQLGGRVAEGRTRFGANVGAIPARNAPAFVRNLLDAWKQSPEAADFHRFVDNGGRQLAEQLVEQHQTAPVNPANPDLFFDWDATTEFSLAGRGAGECSAGVFDLIEVDLANARESLEAGRYYAATLAAAHALLITQKLQPKSDAETFAQFQQHFIAEGLVEASLTGVIAAGARGAAAFDGAIADVTRLVASIRLLYENMDASLRFKK